MAFEISAARLPTEGKAASVAGLLRLEMRLPAFSGSIGVDERMAYTEQLALLLDTGVSIHEALKVLKQQTEDRTLAAILQSLSDEVMEGKPFSLALSKHPEMFSQT